MTVVELVGMAQGDANIALMLSEGALTVLTGYIVIAYLVGAKLTLFQVTFVNLIFVLVRLVNFLALQGVVQRNTHWTKEIRELDPTIPYGLSGGTDRGPIAASLCGPSHPPEHNA
jgi:hypothetical protein